MDDEELENALNNALEDEDYETASKIRDEITKRKKTSNRQVIRIKQFLP